MNKESESLFSVFGIGIRIHNEWRIYPENRGQELSFDTGFIKFERQGIRRKKGEPSLPEDGSISVGLRWTEAKEEMTASEFIDSYVKQLVSSDEKKRFGKTQKTLNIREERRFELGGQQCVFLVCEYMASTKLAKGNAQKVVVLNLAFLDESSRRIIIGTAMTEEPTMAVKREELEKTLLTIRCED